MSDHIGQITTHINLALAPHWDNADMRLQQAQLVEHYSRALAALVPPSPPTRIVTWQGGSVDASEIACIRVLEPSPEFGHPWRVVVDMKGEAGRGLVVINAESAAAASAEHARLLAEWRSTP